MSFKSEVNKLIDRFTANLTHYKSNSNVYNEQACRGEYVNPFFELLGWDIENRRGVEPHLREVIFEQNLGQAGRSDYSMALSGVPVYFTETKKPSVDISRLPDPAFQTRRYGWSSRLRISVLTNFEYLVIYDTTIPPKSGDDCNVAVLKRYHYLEYADKADEIYELLSRDTVYSGNFDNVLNKYFGSTFKKGLNIPVDTYFLNQINEWRIKLGNFLYKTKGYSIDIINDVVQEFINQIVFLRICEDKNLPLYHTLKEITQDEGTLLVELEKLFKEADKKYNSGLFNSNYVIFDLNNDIIKEIVEQLYYPQSPYLFNLIEPNLLGQIYEMFLAQYLTVNSSGNIDLAEKKENINRDIVTTPEQIVKYMVNKSLKEICNGKTPTEILDLKIADIACGSGIYLIEVFEYLVRYCVDWYKTNNPTHLIDTAKGDKKLPLEDKKQILQSCIFGIDIDVHAVEIAQFNLLIKLLDDETEPSIHNSTPVLPDLKSNILHGNTLVDFNNIDITKLSQDEKNAIIPFDWSNINNGIRFDLIIGNPPYVNTKDMNNILPAKEVQVFKKKYVSSYKQFDKYFMFIERAIQKVKDKGYICYIIPNKFSKIKSGWKLRKLLTDVNYVVEYIDFGSAQLFKDKTIYSSILLLKKEKQQQFKYSEVTNVLQWWGNQSSANEMILNSSILTETPWALVPEKDKMDLINRLYSNAERLDKVADLFNGVQTSAERPPVYWFSQEEITRETEDTFEIHKFDDYYTIEKGILKRYFKPVSRYEQNLFSYDIFNTNKWIIFPYDSNGELYPIDVMKERFPNTFDYLKDRYDILRPKQIDPTGRRDVPTATADTWYQYGRDQAFTAFNNTPKLIVGVLSKRPMYLYDTNDFVIASGGTAGYCAISEKIGSPYCLEYLQAYLTHPITEWLLSIIGSDFEGEYYSRGTNVLESIPVKKLDFNNSDHKKIYEDVVAHTRRIYAINEDLKGMLSKTQKTALLGEKKQLIETIEKLISMIYCI